MNRLIWCTVVILLSIPTLRVGPTAAENPFPQVGIVVDLNAPADHYQLMRKKDGKRVKKEIDAFITLYENDVLWINCQHKVRDNEEVRLTLQLADGEKTLTCKDSPYPLKSKRPYFLLDNFTESIKEAVFSLFAGLNDEYHRAQLTSLAVRGRDGRFFMPLIGRSGAHLVAEVRDLHLAWSGGNAPYALRIRAEQATTPLAEMSGLQEARVRLKGVALKPGDYILEIEDTHGQRLTRHFQAVPRGELPTLPNQAFSRARSNAEKHLRDTIYAAWLSDQDPLLWSLEAYQLVADIASKFYPAELLRLRLEGKI